MNKQYTVLPLDGAECFTHLAKAINAHFKTRSAFEIQLKLQLEMYFMFIGNIHLSLHIMDS